MTSDIPPERPRSPDRAEQLFSWLLGLSVLGWSVLGLWHADALNRWTVVSVSVSTLHATVGLLFLRRSAELGPASSGAIVQALPALVASGIAFRWAPEPAQWPLGVELVFALATAWTVLSLSTLGRSFAVLPGRRELVVRGPYRWVRHPAYLGELLLIQLVAVAAWDIRAALLCAATVPLTALRISAEETALRTDPAWADYCTRTRWRLLPGLW